MEGLRKRAWGLGAFLAIAGGLIAITPQNTMAAGRTEDWMLRHAPGRVGPYGYLPSTENPLCTYRMDKATYDALEPYGIVARVYDSGPKSYDVVLIASNKKASFHDPRVCFVAQGWAFNDLHKATVDVPGRGAVPVTVVNMTNADKQNQIAAFFYQSDGKFFATSQELTWYLFLEQLKGHTKLEGVFYRFIPQYSGATEDDLKTFVKQYLTDADKASGGFF